TARFTPGWFKPCPLAAVPHLVARLTRFRLTHMFFKADRRRVAIRAIRLRHPRGQERPQSRGRDTVLVSPPFTRLVRCATRVPTSVLVETAATPTPAF